MRRPLVATVVLAAALVAALTASASSGNVITRCVPDKSFGLEVQNKVPLVVYCGTAKASLRSGGKTTRYKAGACYRVPGTLNAGFGKFTALSHPTPIASAFLLVVPATKDGTFRLGVLTVQQKGKSLSASHVRAVVTRKRSHVTFSGRFANGPTFTGSVTCGK